MSEMIKEELTPSRRFDRVLATILLVMLCIQIVPIEGGEVSVVKVGIMAVMPLMFFVRTPFITKALFYGMLYWLMCYFVAIFHPYFRFSTLGYLGLFIITFIVYYGLLQKGAFSLGYFKRFLGVLIKIFAIVLVLQQACMLVGIHYMPIINLDNQAFLAIDKLASLCIEPSHTARILAVAMLCYWRCLELSAGGVRPSVKQLFQGENRWVTISFLYCMLTMGSGTAFIALGCLSFYFISLRTAFYAVLVIVSLFFIGDSLEIKQMQRVKAIGTIMMGENDDIAEADESAARRIVPLLNTLKMDPFDGKNWVGMGSDNEKGTKESIFKKMYMEYKISIIDQYGILGLIPSLILFFTCIIRRFFSLEMLLFVILFGLSLVNVAYVWGAMFMFAAVRHFQEQSDC